MTPLEAAIVRRKLRRIRGNATTLERVVSPMTPASYDGDEIIRRAVERLLQESIDAAVDCNNHLLRTRGEPPAEDYFSSFVALGRAGIIDAALARRLAPAAGLRNRIVHEYEEIDHALILQAAQSAPDELRAYVAAVEQYLDGANA